MNPSATAYLADLLAIAAAYLIGAIPFGYLTARWVRGIDIRTVGSGNIGATNVGRVLGFKFFVLVFLLDMLKGFGPTYGFPRLVAHSVGDGFAQVGVLVALATILGHNFPIYLKLRGGKGVATSLGALLALDWVASLASALGFVVSLVLTRYVSLSSLLGGVVFLAVYFGRVDDPWNRNHVAMSVATIGLVGLLIVRHRKNLGRIRAGTEPKVSFRKKPPAGRIAWVLVPALAVVALGAVYALSVRASSRPETTLGAYRLVEVERVSTGHQRAERVAYADGGRLLAVTCPRYNRLVLYRVTEAERLEVLRDIPLEGRPVAVSAARDRLFVLERPAGDRRHVEPGWWEAFDLQGTPAASRQPAGMYPDDLAAAPDGRHLLILTSGRAEGDAERPAPALEVVEIAGAKPRTIGRLEFDAPRDDPCRLALSASGLYASVTLLGSNQVASIDVSDRSRPMLIGREALPPAAPPHLSVEGDDAILMGLALDRDAAVLSWPGASGAGCVAGIVPRATEVVFLEPASRRLMGRLPLFAGALNLSEARPMGLAFSPERGLLAVASRTGSVHLISIKPDRPGRPAPAKAPQVASRGCG